MPISSIIRKDEMGASGAEATFMDFIRFKGSAVYADGGTDETAVLRAAFGKNITPIGVIQVRTIGTHPKYEPRIVHTPASVTSAATFATADQDTKTITYKLNGGVEQTVTLSGAHTTAAHLVTSLDAVAGIHAYLVGGQVHVKTIKNGALTSLEITGGTANTVYLFPITVNVGSNTPLIAIFDAATGLDAGLGAASTDLSVDEFECVLLSK